MCFFYLGSRYLNIFPKCVGLLRKQQLCLYLLTPIILMLATCHCMTSIQTMSLVFGRVQLDDGGRYTTVFVANQWMRITHDLLVIGE